VNGENRKIAIHEELNRASEAGESHIFSKLMKYREEADYNPTYTFTAEDYEELRKEVLELSHHIREYLNYRTLG